MLYSKLKTVYNTVKYLRVTQILHQIKYRVFAPKTLQQYRAKKDVALSYIPCFTITPTIETCWDGKACFKFLNISVSFDKEIDWNFQKHGKLWNYNLQYGNYMLQSSISNERKAEIVKSQYAWLTDGRLPLEPYPASLRAINVIRWISQSQYQDSEVLQYLYADLSFLTTRLEYHLLGNHLLENAFALMMGGAFFGNDTWLKIALKTLEVELTEQVLSDGAHFELSPMYHQIIFFRILELIDWYSKWEGKEQEFEDWLKWKASMMRVWLKNITFKNGDIPHFNDSTKEVAYPSPWLISYARHLEIPTNNISLGESGYRRIDLGEYECRIDFAQLGPSYQPGHAHADALSFIVYYKATPLFVEQGTSTYQIGEIRTRERSTAAHNTVVVNQQNQSNVWGGFRVAERAKTEILVDGEYCFSAQHDGYRKLNIIHRRTFEFERNAIKIIDELCGNDKFTKEFHLHIHPSIRTKKTDNSHVELSNGITISFEHSLKIQMEPYEMSNGYNSYKIGNKLIVSFINKLTTNILMEN